MFMRQWRRPMTFSSNNALLSSFWQLNICSRTSISCQQLDNRALFDEKVIGGRHCLINMATPSRVARHSIMSTNGVIQSCCSG
ncbi:hypothetical protein PoB_001662200 [Plakobranchus ocellatus]|uniref:Secreted protein n=1 Tax=Plakobranchus ocellatus TaxID=259542 RepID=A0AAV3Z6G3_9GAST|nr:hypothetical protein PoB_001662200 [Plakobranchus ocellatus]